MSEEATTSAQTALVLQSLAQQKLGAAGPRSPHWPKVRDEWLTANGTCAACGGRSHLNVHHKKPFHLHPDLELDPKNFITLCEEPSKVCHYHFGHNGLSWSCYNPHVEEDAALFLQRRKEAKYD